jgi:long-subunit acyl-CoA synthetase (AMP-forming)
VFTTGADGSFTTGWYSTSDVFIFKLDGYLTVTKGVNEIKNNGYSAVIILKR